MTEPIKPTQDEKCRVCGVGRRNHIDPNPIEDIGHTFQPNPTHAEGPVTYFEKEGLWYSCGPGFSRVHLNRGAAYNHSLDCNRMFAQGQSAERAKWEKLKAKLIDGREIYVKDPDCGLEAEALGWAIEKMVELEKEPT